MSTHQPTIYVPESAGIETRVSTYDRLNALLVSLLLLVGLFTTMLFMIWLTGKYRARPVAAEINFLIGEPGEEKPEGVADDINEPGVEEFPEVDVPQLADSLLAVTNSISSIMARNEQRDGSAEAMGRGKGLGSRDGGGGGGSGIPAWNVELEAKDRNAYRKQLSFFKIEVGAVHKMNNRVFRLSDPAGASRLVESSRAGEKAKRTHLWGHRNKRLLDWDKDILRQAGLQSVDDFIVGQFYPQEMINQLRGLEVDYAKRAGREASEIRETTFKVVTAGNGYQFEVRNQTYRR